MSATKLPTTPELRLSAAAEFAANVEAAVNRFNGKRAGDLDANAVFFARLREIEAEAA
jgi:hypothetical protein